MSRPNWYKKAPRRYRPFSKIFSRRRRWSDTGRWLVIMAVLLTFAEYFTQGAVTWPDTVMRTGHGVVKSAVTSQSAEQEAISSGWGELKGVTTEDYPTPDIPYGAVEHRVKRIVDGDTVYLKDGTKVRLHGIDTPERDQPYGKQATRNLDKLIGRTVFVVERDTDRYGRLVGTLYTPEGVNVNLEMVCNGSAWWYSRYAKNNRAMASCQGEAKEAGLGLWADDDPMPPWEWRRR